MVPTRAGALHVELRDRIAHGGSFCFMDGHHVGSSLRATWNTRPGEAAISYDVVNDVPVFSDTSEGTRVTADLINSFIHFIIDTKSEC